MTLAPIKVRPTGLTAYSIGSTDRVFYEMGRREVYLDGDREHGFLVWGEVPDEGPGTIADVGQILLEFALSCEGRKSLERTQAEMRWFGQHVGQALAARITQCMPNATRTQRARFAVESVLNSLDIAYRSGLDGTVYVFDSCPLSRTARAIGLTAKTALAREAFEVLCETVVKVLDPAMAISVTQIPDGPYALTMLHRRGMN